MPSEDLRIYPTLLIILIYLYLTGTDVDRRKLRSTMNDIGYHNIKVGCSDFKGRINFTVAKCMRSGISQLWM